MSPTARGARWWHRLLVLGVVVGVLAASWSIYQWVVEPGPPSAFYRPPATLPSGPPGTLVRTADLATKSGAQQAWRVLYTSTDPDGAPIAVSGVVVAPTGAPPAGGWPVIAWAHGTTGVDDRCAPSLEADGGISRVPELASLVTAGTVVAITDYPGLGTPGPHPYLVGGSEGRAVLDSIRAARALLGDRTSATAAVFGHSQGGHATLFAAQLAPTYAPELHVVGVAPMAPPSALGELLRRDKDETAGIVLTALAIASWTAWYPGLSDDGIVHATARPLVERVGHRCITTTAEGISDLPDVIALRASFLSTDPATAPGWQPHFETNSLVGTALTMPVLVSQGLKDTLVRPDVTEAYVHDACVAGSSIELDTYPTADHFKVRTASAVKVRDWLLDRVHGAAAPAGCSTHVQA